MKYLSNIQSQITGLKSVFGILLLLASLISYSQEEEEAPEVDRPVRPPFESTWLIDNQTVIVPTQGTLEMMIQHRFGKISSGVGDLWGLYLPSNIRLGFNYTIKENLSIGFGTTKGDRILDFNAKYSLIKQTRSGRIPVSVTYYGDMAIATMLPREDLPNQNATDRYSYFHQFMISRKISYRISVQLSPSLTHYNLVEETMKNDHIAVAGAARIKFSPQSAFIVNVDQPVTKHTQGNPQPNLSFGIEVATSSHAFQVFMGNYTGIINQKNNFFNTNDPWNGDFVIGFNITRLWNF